MASRIEPALQLLTPWRFGAEGPIPRRLLGRLIETLPNPTPRHLGALLADEGALPAPVEDLDIAEHLHRRQMSETAPTVEPSRRQVVAWALDELSFTGAEVERRERAAWRGATVAATPEQDAAAATMWAAWFARQPWTIRETWEAAFLGPARSAFRAVLEASRIPRAAQARHLEDLQESFFFMLLGGSEGPPGWAELAVRVLETAEPGPVDALAALLDSRACARIGQYATSRGHWPATAGFLWPDRPRGLPRARALAAAIERSPAKLEAYLDAHTVKRVLATWQTPGTTHPGRTWSVVVQNRGRARGRLRALLAATATDRLQTPLLALDNLHSRTIAAVKRYAWAWAWQGVAGDFPFDIAQCVTPPCEALPDGVAALQEDAAPLVRTWVLLVTLKGRLGHLRRWVQTGGTGDRDSTWARLLADLPDALRDPVIEGRRASTYHRVRADLTESLEEHVEAVEPALRRVAALRANRSLRANITRCLQGTWDTSIPYPKAGFPTFLDNAKGALCTIARQGAEPCTT